MAINDFEVQIVNLLNSSPSEYKGLSGAIEIDSFSKTQIDLYNHLIDTLYNLSPKTQDLSINYYKIKREISEYFVNFSNGFTNNNTIYSNLTGYLIKKSVIPVINPVTTKKIINEITNLSKFSRHTEELYKYFEKFINFVYCETQIRSHTLRSDFALSITPNYIYVSNYEKIRKQFISTPNKNESPSSTPDGTSVKVTIDYEKLQETIKAFEAQTYKNIATIQNEIAEQKQNINNNISATEALNNMINEQIEGSIKAIRNYETSIEERLKTNHLSVLWDQRAANAARDVKRSGLLLLLVIVVPIVAIFLCADSISTLIEVPNAKTFEDKTLFALQVSRTLLIAVPVILLFWAIKLIIKYYMRSLLLLDDANQRKTIMDTYLSMVKEDEANQKAFPLIMWALCRQVPGHGPDGIEPPDFTEVIRIAKDIKP